MNSFEKVDVSMNDLIPRLLHNTLTVVCCTLILTLLSSCSLLKPTARDLASAPLLEIEKPQTKKVRDAAISGEDQGRAENESLEKLQQDMKTLEEREEAFNYKLTTMMRSNAVPTSFEQSPQGSSLKRVTGRQEIACHFDNADLLEVVRLFMQEYLNADFLIYPGVEGSVTMEVERSMTMDEIRHLLDGVLQINRMTMFYQDDRWHIMPLEEAPIALGQERLLLPGADHVVRGQIIQAYTLRYITASELVKVIAPYLTKGAQVYAHESSGVLLVCDYPHVQAKIDKLIQLFDVGPFAGTHMKVFWPQYVLADELVKELDALAESVSLAAGTDTSANSSLSFVAMPRLNLLLAMSRDSESLEFVDLWVNELDREIPTVLQQNQEEGIYIYSVKNGMATDIVTVLEGLFGEGNTTAAADSKGKDENLPSGVQLTRLSSGIDKNKTTQKTAGPGAVSGSLSGPVTFVVDEITNAILVRSSGTDYRKVLPVIERLDTYPKQALIEVTIAEIQLDESNSLGVEWQYFAKNVGGSPNAQSGLSVDSGLGVVSGGSSLISSGLSYVVENTDRFKAALRAYSGQNRVNVLSAPHILASDNQEAKIDIGDEVPIVTSEYRTTESSSTATTVDKTIQYRNVGVILSVTPHISENGTVRMEISQEVSELSQKTVEGVDSPVFSKRSATTQLAVNDGQTIVIAGLMQQTASKSSSGVPFLARLPLIRYLVGYDGQDFASTELMIFITPHVVLTGEDSDFISRSFLKRLETLRSDMEH
ncbi:type II secretion system secretin GspD [uncultured Desulfuromonas sp.]|uniref:type II secretion system secretin GspD n=1 Tax=uncultured Desulfuromonas sp. TaxID=181013 RepID=UPI002AAA6FDF|nr:type II secretion system secretin GspD [uncultured Desulfuromonas sp.]